MFRSTALEFWILFAIAAAAAIAPLCLAEYLPMIDLPQHAAQLSIGQGWSDPHFHYQELYQVNWLLNHVLAMLIASLIGLFVPAAAAMKAVVILAVVATPLSVAWLLRRLRADLFWALPVFITTFGYAFCWGFVDFMLAVPVGVALLAACFAYCEQPTRGHWWMLLGLMLLCFAAHILVLGLVGLIACGLIFCAQLTQREKLLGVSALALAIPPFIAITWATRHAAPPDTAHPPLEAAFGLQRVHDLLVYQVGINDPQNTLTLWGAVLLILPWLMGARPSKSLRRWLPFALTLLVFFAIPKDMMGVAFIYGRYAIFLLPTLLIALDPPQAPRRVQRYLAFCVVLAGLLLTGAKIRAFNTEASGINAVIEHVPPHHRVLYLGVHNTGLVAPYPAYLHFGCYYQVKRGGPVDFSFAEFFANRYRYKPEADPNLPPNIEWRPELFRWAVHDGYRYDYLLVRGPTMDAWFMDAPVQVRQIAENGEWHLLGLAPLPASPTPPPPAAL
ncbi:MAG TPA: hypothetical protein VL137_05830 [Polyangiaceae bacterium]|nr:hypothetical protein [Polyangiaceae bacterium]